MKYIIISTFVAFGFTAPTWAQEVKPLQPNITVKQNTAASIQDVLGNPRAKAPAKKIENFKLREGGVVNGGGGDARLIRGLILNTKKEHLVSEVIGVFSDENPNLNAVTNVKRLLSWVASGRMVLKNQEAQKILNDMISKGFGKDINQTKFVISKSCKDWKGIEKSASALMGEPRTNICVNPYRIVEDFGPYIQDSDLMGLMVHEFAHHYGYEDADHKLAAAVALDYQLSNEDRNQEGDPLNYLIK